MPSDQALPPLRDPRGVWQPGRSANPGGRPHAVRDVQALAREHTQAAVTTLAEIMADAAAPRSTRISAAVALLDRAWGRPAQSVAISDDRDVDLAERQRAVAAALAVYSRLGVTFTNPPPALEFEGEAQEQEGGEDEDSDNPQEDAGREV